MQYMDALDQISEIHEHLAKGEIYRGYRPVPVALTGIAGLAAGLLQPLVVPTDDGIAFVAYWVTMAVLCGILCGSVIVYNYALRDDDFGRRKTRKVVGQLLPCLAAGIAVTAGLIYTDEHLIPILPGLWTILYSMGIFSSRPYLPRAIGWVALFYLAAGCVLLVVAREGWSLAAWGIGGTFGLGQLAAAWVLYQNKERLDHA